MGIINKGDTIGIEGGSSGVLEKITILKETPSIVNPLAHETDFSESVNVS